MADERLSWLITANNRDAVAAFREVGSVADRELGRAEQKTDRWARGFAVAGGSMVGVAGVAAVGLFSLGNSASDLNETISKTKQVFKGSGDSILAWSEDSAEGFGQSKKQALDAAATFGNLFVQLGTGAEEAAGLSTQMVELASDFASFHNADPTAVIEAMTAAFRGEYDAVQRYVPTISAATVEQQALADTGKRLTSELTAQEKALAVQTLLYEGAGDALGDFDRTADGAANQQRILAAEFENLKANIGAGVLPVMTQLIGVGNDVLGVFNDLDPATQQMVGSTATIATIGVGAAGGLALITSAGIKTVQQLSILRGGFDSFRVGLRGIETGLGGALPNRLGNTIENLGGLGAVAGVAAAGVAVVGGGMWAASRDAEEYAEALAKAREEVLKGGDALETLRVKVQAASMQSRVFDKDVRAATKALEEYDEQIGDATKLTEEASAAQQEYADLLASGTASDNELAAARERVVETSGRQADVQGDLNAAVDEGASSVSGLSAKMSGAASTANVLAASLKNAAAAARSKFTANLDAADAEVSFAAAMDEVRGTADGAAESVGGAGGATKSAAAAAFEAADKQRALRDALVGVDDAARQLEDSQRGLTDAQDDYTAATDTARKAQENFDRVMSGQGTGTKDAAEAAEELSDAQRDVRKSQLDVTAAERNLASARADSTSTAEDIARAELSLEDAQDRVEDSTGRATEAQRVYDGVIGGFPETAEEAIAAQDKLTRAKDAEEQASYRARDAQLAVESAQRQGNDATSTLTRAQADLAGQLDTAGGAAGRAGEKIKPLEERLRDAAREAEALALGIANTGTASEGSIGWVETYIGVLRSIGSKNPELAPLLEGLIRDLQNQINAFTSARIAKGIGVSLGGAKQVREAGGPVLGPTGAAVDITAHAGEYVLDAGTVSAIKRGGPSKGAATGTAQSATAGGVPIVVHIAGITVNAPSGNARDIEDALVRAARSPAFQSAMVESLTSYQRRNGPLPLRVVS